LTLMVDIAVKGFPAMSLDFLFTSPTDGMTKGGILPAILGTTLVTLTTAAVSVPIGVGCAIYLSEYARPNFLTQVIRASIRNLAAVPSVVYGLFGVAVFARGGLSLGPCVLASGLTLGLMTLPYIITTTEEALQNVPRGHREAALALGATPWETTAQIVLPSALPGILTGTILGLSRAAGETAPILVTGVVFFRDDLGLSLREEFMALPYHLYSLATQHHAIDAVRPLAYGTALVLVTLVFTLNLFAFIIRYRFRNR
jgi:phosphate transport system permease protein